VTQTVSGQNGQIRNVFVYLRNISHSRPDDLDVLLVAPGGQTVMLMSDVCGGIPIPNGRTLRFNDDDPPMPDGGPCTLPSGAGGNFRPTDVIQPPETSLPAPAPPGPYGTSLDALNGLNPNGTWRLYIHDDLREHSGYLESFQISFDLAPPADLDVIAPNSAITGHPDSRTASRRARFTFSATEVGSSFACRIDTRAWASCSSPKSYTRLTTGRHQFQVRATDKAGNVDATPAVWRWRIRR
jgi:subtilisin-like proprotein convertase family protein